MCWMYISSNVHLPKLFFDSLAANHSCYLYMCMMLHVGGLSESVYFIQSSTQHFDVIFSLSAHQQMNRDSQMWPVFSTPVKTSSGRRSPHDSIRKEESLPYEEEMSGMFTLKRKKEKEKMAGEEISRSSSISSRPSSSESSGHRRRSQSMEPSQSRTSRSSSQNQLWGE